MAKKTGAKLVLELLAKGMSGREIRSTRHVSQRSIKLVWKAAERAGVTLKLLWEAHCNEVARGGLPGPPLFSMASLAFFMLYCAMCLAW